MALGVGGGQDVGGGARHRGEVVDRADLGHALAVALLAFGQAGGQLAAGVCLAGGVAERLGPHDDALAVARQHQHVVVGAAGRLAAGVELADVAGGCRGEVLHLASAQPDPGGPADRLDRLVERPAGGLDGGLAKPVGVLFLGQVQHRVGRVQVGGPGGAVGDACDAGLAEHCGQAPGVTGLGVGVPHPGCVGHLGQPLFPLGTHVQVVLQELPQQLPAVGLELLLQPRVR